MIKSEPSGGQTATKGSEVVLRVSSGPKLAKVPVLVGSQRSLAVQQIRGRGFVPSVEEVEDSAARRTGDPPGAERGLAAAARLDRLDRRSPRAKKRRRRRT